MPTESSLIIAAEHNFKVMRGDSSTVTLEFCDAANQPMDFTGAFIKMEARRNIGDPTYVKRWKIGDGVSVNGNAVTLSKFEALPAGLLFYDLQATFPSGDTVTYIKGIIKVVDDATK